MTYKLAYWVFAYGLTLVAVAIALRGISFVRRGDIDTHRKYLDRACNLIIFFVITYVFKMLILGREDKSNWSLFYLVTLYIHEALIGGMLFCGIYTRVMAFKFKESLAGVVSEQNRLRRARHKRFGKLTIFFSLSALITASMVLFGMFRRAGLI